MLFKRTNHGLVLTEAGENFFSDCNYIVEFAQRSIEKALEIDRKENQHIIRVGTSPLTPAKFILDLWNQLNSILPNLKIEIIPFVNSPINSHEILKNLGRQIDLVAGIYDDKFKDERGFQTVKLEDKMINFAVSINNPLSNKKNIEINDLKTTGVMLIKKGWNKYLDTLIDLC